MALLGLSGTALGRLYASLPGSHLLRTSSKEVRAALEGRRLTRIVKEVTGSSLDTSEMRSSWFPGIRKTYDYSRYAISSMNADEFAGRLEDDDAVSSGVTGDW